jgi:hypothetical protein
VIALAPGTGTRLWGAMLDSIPPASGAVVMGTGIVSVALLLVTRLQSLGHNVTLTPAAA